MPERVRGDALELRLLADMATFSTWLNNAKSKNTVEERHETH